MHNPLNTRQLYNFYEIASANSIRKAAKFLNLTTSAVSHSLKKLEEDLNCKLFIRNTRTIHLTPAGERLHSYTKELLPSLTRARHLVSGDTDVSQKTLRIGTSHAACQYIIPLALRELRESFPKVNIQIVAGSSYEVIEQLENDKIDVAIYPTGSFDRIRSKSSIGSDQLHLVVNPLHEWAVAGKVNFDEIEDQRIILTDVNDFTFDLINEYFRSYGKMLMPFIEIANDEVIKRFVELDIGVGILPKWMIRKEVENNSLVSFPINRRALNRRWVVAHSDERTPNFTESVFIGIVTNVALNLFSDVDESIQTMTPKGARK